MKYTQICRIVLIALFSFIISHNCSGQADRVYIRLGDAGSGCGSNGACDIETVNPGNQLARVTFASQGNISRQAIYNHTPLGPVTYTVKMKIVRRTLRAFPLHKAQFRHHRYTFYGAVPIPTTMFRHYKRVSSFRNAYIPINTTFKVRHQFLGLGHYKMIITGVRFE